MNEIYEKNSTSSILSKEASAYERPAKRLKDSSQQPKRQERFEKDTVSFSIQCKDGALISLSPAQATCLQEKCAFFRNAFRQGTTENNKRVFVKPDWSEETSNAIVALITLGKTKTPSDFANFSHVANQILVSLLVRHPLTRRNISGDINKVQLLAKRWRARKSEFEFESASFTSGANLETKWQGLFVGGVVALRGEEDLTVELLGGPKEEPFLSKKNVFRVGASTPLCVSVYHTCTYLSDLCSDGHISSYGSGDFELFFPANLGAGLYLKNRLELAVNYFKKIQNEIVLLGGSVHDLLKSSDIVEDLIVPYDESKLCMLRVLNPDSWRLGKFIHASQKCVDNPGTLFWKLEDRSFYAVKTTKDIRIMMECLSCASKDHVAVSGYFHLKEHAPYGWKAF